VAALTRAARLRRLCLAGCAAALAGCAAGLDAPRLAYQCPRGLSFEARLYQDMALLEGLRGHLVLERVAASGEAGAPASHEAALQYADPTVRASFALGLDQRLVRLDYTGIPDPVYCERAPALDNAAPAPVQAAARPGPRPPRTFNPGGAPTRTNIRIGNGQNGPN